MDTVLGKYMSDRGLTWRWLNEIVERVQDRSVSSPIVSKWRTGKGKVPPEVAFAIEDETLGAITAREILLDGLPVADDMAVARKHHRGMHNPFYWPGALHHAARCIEEGGEYSKAVALRCLKAIWSHHSSSTSLEAWMRHLACDGGSVDPETQIAEAGAEPSNLVRAVFDLTQVMGNAGMLSKPCAYQEDGVWLFGRQWVLLSDMFERMPDFLRNCCFAYPNGPWDIYLLNPAYDHMQVKLKHCGVLIDRLMDRWQSTEDPFTGFDYMRIQDGGNIFVTLITLKGERESMVIPGDSTVKIDRVK